MDEATPSPPQKTCPRCRRDLPITEFYQRRSRPNGRHSHCKSCQKDAVRQQREDPEFMARTLAHHRWYGYAIRMEVLRAYGGDPPRCACCGEQEPVFLALDHVHNDGAVDRQLIGESHRIFRWLRRNGFPPGYQVLCHNCNWAKRMGGCPHAGAKSEHPQRPEPRPSRVKTHCKRGHPYDEANTYVDKRGERQCRACSRERRREERRRVKASRALEGLAHQPRPAHSTQGA